MKLYSHADNGKASTFEFLMFYELHDDVIETVKRINQWCEENCQGEWTIKRIWQSQGWAPDIQVGDLVQTRITLSSGDDAMRFKLTFP